MKTGFCSRRVEYSYPQTKRIGFLSPQVGEDCHWTGKNQKRYDDSYLKTNCTGRQALGGSSASDCADRVRDLLSKLDLTLKLGDLGITEADIPWMTENCQKVSAGNLVNTPVSVTAELISEIYRKSI